MPSTTEAYPWDRVAAKDSEYSRSLPSSVLVASDHKRIWTVWAPSMGYPDRPTRALAMSCSKGRLN